MDEMLGLKAVITATGISRSKIYVLMGQGAFPRPKRVGRRAIRWAALEIKDWLKSRPMGGSWREAQ